MRKLSKRAAALAGAAIVIGLGIALTASSGPSQSPDSIANAEAAVARADADRMATCGPGTEPAQAQALPPVPLLHPTEACRLATFKHEQAGLQLALLQKQLK